MNKSILFLQKSTYLNIFNNLYSTKIYFVIYSDCNFIIDVAFFSFLVTFISARHSSDVHNLFIYIPLTKNISSFSIVLNIISNLLVKHAPASIQRTFFPKFTGIFYCKQFIPMIHRIHIFREIIFINTIRIFYYFNLMIYNITPETNIIPVFISNNRYKSKININLIDFFKLIRIQLRSSHSTYI